MMIHMSTRCTSLYTKRHFFTTRSISSLFPRRIDHLPTNNCQVIHHLKQRLQQKQQLGEPILCRQSRSFIPGMGMGLPNINPAQIKQIQEQLARNPAAQAHLSKMLEYMKTKYSFDPTKPPSLSDMMKMARDPTLMSLAQELSSALNATPSSKDSTTVETVGSSKSPTLSSASNVTEGEVVAPTETTKKEGKTASWISKTLFGPNNSQ